MVDKVKEFVDEQLETIAQTKGYKILEARALPFGMLNQGSADFLIQNIIITNQEAAKPAYG